MPHCLGIDLAERHSAAVMVRSDLSVAGQWELDSGPTSHKAGGGVSIAERLERLCLWWNQIELEALTLDRYERVNRSNVVVIVEDMHLHARNPKPGLRVQGALLMLLSHPSLHAPVRWELVSPNVWRRHYEYKREAGVTTKAWAKAKCDEFDFTARTHGKALVDVRDAYLIARYGVEREP